MVSGMFGCAPGGLWSREPAYYIRQYCWELLLAVPAALPIKNWLAAKLVGKETQGSRVSGLVLTLAPKGMALALFACAVIRLLSSGTRSFLYFQF